MLYFYWWGRYHECEEKTRKKRDILKKIEITKKIRYIKKNRNHVTNKNILFIKL